jgi:hypothetical protein
MPLRVSDFAVRCRVKPDMQVTIEYIEVLGQKGL